MPPSRGARAATTSVSSTGICPVPLDPLFPLVAVRSNVMPASSIPGRGGCRPAGRGDRAERDAGCAALGAGFLGTGLKGARLPDLESLAAADERRLFRNTRVIHQVLRQQHAAFGIDRQLDGIAENRHLDEITLLGGNI